MSQKEHSFPEIGKSAGSPAEAGGDGGRFRPLFAGAVTDGGRSENCGRADENDAENGHAGSVREARKKGMDQGRRAGILDAHTRCAGELIELLEILLAAAEQYQNRKKELLASSGQWILTLAEAICRKVIDNGFEQDAGLLERSLGRWVASGIRDRLPFGAADSDALQVLLSAGEMLLPCEQATAERLKLRLDKLSNLADDQMRPDADRQAASIAELVREILPKPEPS